MDKGEDESVDKQSFLMQDCSLGQNLFEESDGFNGTQYLLDFFSENCYGEKSCEIPLAEENLENARVSTYCRMELHMRILTSKF